jgi:predicted transcriptional regulator
MRLAEDDFMTRLTRLSRREREILDLVNQRNGATAAEIRAAMDDPPTDAAVRSTLRILVGKGHLRIEEDGPRYTYWPTRHRAATQRSELRHVWHTFFGGSIEGVLAALLDIKPGSLSPEERRRLKQLIDAAKKTEER